MESKLYVQFIFTYDLIYKMTQKRNITLNIITCTLNTYLKTNVIN